MQEFSLDGNEYIELNKLLKILNLVGSGGEANQRIEKGEVIVNGALETRKRKKLREGDKISFYETSIIITKVL